MAAAENLGVALFIKIDCALPPWLRQAIRPVEVRQTKLGTFQRWELLGGGANFVPNSGGKVRVILPGSKRRSKIVSPNKISLIVPIR
ncbi:MAG: hypothetical protein WCT37_04235 [Patescibacteria group bacterium]